jgi:hypothetical protein
MVLPKAMADRARSMAQGGGLPSDADIDPRAGYGSGASLTPWQLNPGAPGTPDMPIGQHSVWSGPDASALNAIQRTIDLMIEQHALAVAHSTFWGPRHTVQHRPVPDISASLAGLHAQQAAIMTTRASMPPVVAPRAPGAPPVAPPTAIGGPGWFGGGTASAGGTGSGTGPLTIIIQLDGQEIGRASLPEVRRDARGGCSVKSLSRRAR